ncbi:SNF2-related protein [Zhenhengia yiwuensis]|uniref:DEAD/DEAH box helicase n=1 Tax=Zhenhengia yiwuensis TaxID=2763666 RepID=A0A926EKT9_9FIRM|nr:DEAD/DEAH box helicase [Zhenhengia yiwuensis]MBC8580167.1 DEAD/DEAH box helicase [Zhenhengia yiwuensis]
MHFKPHSYQEYAIDKIIELPAVGLFMDMGMGKTVSTLTAVLELLFDYFEVSKVLVIAPLRVADTTWTDEVDKWEHLSELKVAKVLGTQDERIKALGAKADIYVINRENVSWLVERYKARWPFDMVVVDELSSFKSPKSKRFKDLKKVLPYIKRIVGLTGTPAPNSLLDLWPQLYLLDRGERLGKTLTSYREKYFLPDKRNQHIVYTYKLKPFADEDIHKQIGDICISLSADDYLELPERIDNIIKVKLPEKVMKQYKEFEKEQLLELQGTDITAATAGVVVGKLLQMANGQIYDDEGEVHKIHEAKLEALSELVDTGQPLLVFYNFKHDYECLMSAFKNPRTLKTSQDIKDWNEGKIQLLLAHPASVGHGLNLQAGGNIIIWYGLTWSLELYQQANARLYRQGQKNNVIIHHLVAEGTVDEHVMEVLQTKDKGQQGLLQAVKAMI